MINYILGAFLLLLAGGILFYVIRARRRGQKCIGCPYAKQCSGTCGCHASNETENNG